jgi:hypothetical protein
MPDLLIVSVEIAPNRSVTRLGVPFADRSKESLPYPVVVVVSQSDTNPNDRCVLLRCPPSDIGYFFIDLHQSDVRIMHCSLSG